MSALATAKQVVLQYFRSDIQNPKGVVVGVAAVGGCIQVHLLKPITQQFQSVNGIPIEYHVTGPAQQEKEQPQALTE